VVDLSPALEQAQNRLIELRAAARAARLAAGKPVDIAQQRPPETAVSPAPSQTSPNLPNSDKSSQAAQSVRTRTLPLPGMAVTPHDGETAVSAPPWDVTPSDGGSGETAVFPVLATQQAQPGAADVRARTLSPPGTAVGAAAEETAVSWAMANALAYVDQRRRAAGIGPSDPQTGETAVPTLPQLVQASDQDRLETAVYSDPAAPAGEVGPLAGTVRHWPDLALAARAAGEITDYRLYLIIYAIIAHETGEVTGNIDLDRLKHLLIAPDSPWRQPDPETTPASCKRWFRGKINRLCKAGWAQIETNGRLYLTGVIRLADKLDVARAACQPVDLDLETVVKASRGEFNAACFATWHVARPGAERPISQAAVEEVTAVPERTQRHYCQVAGIERTENYQIGDVATAANMQEAAYQHGRSVFEMVDHEGKQGKRGGRRVMRRLPNSYGTKKYDQPGHKGGARRRLNKGIRQAGDKGRRLPVEENFNPHQQDDRMDKLYHSTATDAAKTFNRTRQPVYWYNQPSRSGAGLWYMLK
jgi:hypothetical protein